MLARIVPRAAAAAVVFAALLAAGAQAAAAQQRPAPPVRGLQQIGTGPDGGTVWQGWIPNRFVAGAGRPCVFYFPPGATAGQRYPVLYLLQGFPGSPYQYPSGLGFATVADTAIALGSSRPFVAVAPPAGLTPRFHGEWAGPWEDYLVGDVLPWVDRHLPVLAGRTDTAVAGLSSGGYGAVDIGLRHPRLFGTLEAWSGYFRPIRDGVLRYAGRAELAAHDPTLLLRRKAPLLRRLGTRVYLSSGTTRDRRTAAATRVFDRVLAAERIPHELVLAPGGHDGRFWHRQLPAAIRYAFPAA